MKLYGLKNCDTCKKAITGLEAAGHSVEFIDIRADANLKEKVPVWLEAVGGKALVNTRSTTWRGLDDTQRARAETDPAALLIDNATLIKRPVIECEGEVHVSWSKAVQAALT